jgi:DNA invertase Pin-like site-specific DNA recombinase
VSVEGSGARPQRALVSGADFYSTPRLNPEGRIDVMVVYKLDRLTRPLADAKLIELFDAHGVSFISITPSFNTTTSMGRLTLNMLLSFAQFERGVIGERIRDKIAASKKKGIWVGGLVPLGYRVLDRKLVVDEDVIHAIRFCVSARRYAFPFRSSRNTASLSVMS